MHTIRAVLQAVSILTLKKIEDHLLLSSASTKPCHRIPDWRGCMSQHASLNRLMGCTGTTFVTFILLFWG